MKEIIKVQGMSCEHCKASVEKGVSAVEGVTKVTVDLAGGTATVEGDYSMDAVKNAIEDAGFEVGA